ncbi:hypothetical protein [uncultured Microbulbifer sp.]|uniref:hypothetical protein n=1 Tax=uncultured Microbulbifer sp. TaxID=348147 RepID=UPI00261C25BF|nr:hypothetical protein [uncultured Microbulbifer sp.]
MHPIHKKTLGRYEVFRHQDREIAADNLPPKLKGILELCAIDHRALVSVKTWENLPERKVCWDWTFAARYKALWPKIFDMSVWFGNTLCSLSLGRPTYKGTEMRLDFIERSPKNCPHAGEMFRVSLLAFETYGNLIGASKIRIMQPMNDKLVNYYISHGGFSFVGKKQG